MKGCIAKRYGDLIHEIWRGTAKTIAPLKLRVTYLYLILIFKKLSINSLIFLIYSGQLENMLHVLMVFNNMILKNYLPFY